MKQPTVSEAYAMIRLLKKRAAAGDGEKIQQLEQLIAEARDKTAQLALDRFFSSEPGASGSKAKK